MTPENFIYWLQGFVEMNPNAMLTHTQWLIIKDHLALVLKKETPKRVEIAPPVVTGPIAVPFPSPAFPVNPPNNGPYIDKMRFPQPWETGPLITC